MGRGPKINIKKMNWSASLVKLSDVPKTKKTFFDAVQRLRRNHPEIAQHSMETLVWQTWLNHSTVIDHQKMEENKKVMGLMESQKKKRFCV